MESQLRAHTQVLVVGAGPSGLAAALVLARLGISVRIIDKNAARSDKSKALAVHAGTLECLKAAIGTQLVRELIGAGQPTRAAGQGPHCVAAALALGDEPAQRSEKPAR